MEDPNYYRGDLEYYREGEVEIIEFYYPTDSSWKCINCGNCCRDLDKRTRMILLLPEDIKRIEETGADGFFEDWDEGSFIGIMCKEGGKCVFYSGEGCKIYEKRALLCRMYPFWLEKQGSYFVFGIDNECPGSGGKGKLDEEFFSNLLQMALDAVNF